MKCILKISMPLLKYTDGATSCDLDIATLGDLRKNISERFPKLAARILNESGKFEPCVNVYINDTDVRVVKENEFSFKENDLVSIIPTIAGG